MFEIQPRFSETDGLGHINNTVLPIWFEEARVDLFRIFNPSLSLQTWNLILKKYEVEFVAQIWRDAPVRIETGIAHLGSSSLTVAQRVVQEEKVVAVGHTVLIHFDYKAGKPAPIPEDIKAKLEPHVIAEGD
jgi:acyl-CoA thioester hydrolase